jgi:rhamnulokinase
MSRSCYLAFDLGASSGRAILGYLENDRLEIKEIHRFENRMLKLHGHLHWNLYGLLANIKEGMRKCVAGEIKPVSVGIDTWGVDFGLLAEDGSLIGLPCTYRDSRTEGMMESFFASHSSEAIYSQTGTQSLPINTLFQLWSMIRERNPLLLNRTAKDLLFMPDLFHYFLAGVKKTEFSIATTSQLFDLKEMRWQEGLCLDAGCDEMMQEVVMPGSILGSISQEICEQTGFEPASLVAVGTHDTASAVAAVPAQGTDWAFISSGTWSLMGVELKSPILTEEAHRANFTNEGGVNGTIRFLKNIAGLYLLQKCREIWSVDKEVSYDELIDEAESACSEHAYIDPDHLDFLNTSNMVETIKKRCQAIGIRVPHGRPEIVLCIMRSLALKYRYTLEQLRTAQSKPINRIHIIGGGAKNRMLCQFTADATRLPVYAGPVEATAIGNLLVQAMAGGKVSSLDHLRGIVRDSVEIKIYEPNPSPEWEEAWEIFQTLVMKQRPQKEH